MTLIKPLSAELIRIAGGIFACFLLSLWFGNFWLWIVLAIIAYLAWHLFNLMKLIYWLQDTKQVPPQSKGLWLTIFDHLYFYQKSNNSKIKRLQRGLKLFEETATALPDATVILTKDSVIEWCNGSAERLLGLNKSRDYGQRIDNLVRNPLFVKYLNQDNNEDVIEIPSPIEESIMLRVRAVSYGKNRRLLLARNISRLYHLYQIKSDFIANVSHELRTPLTVICGYVESLYEKTKASDKQFNPLKQIKTQSERMLHIIDDLLFLSGLETATTSGQKEIVNVASLVKNLAENTKLLSGQQQHNIEITIDDSLYIRGSYNELESAFSNLIVNAIKYTRAKGQIWISWKKTDQGAQLEIKDSGIGVSAQQIPRLTERFYRVDVGRSREQGGTGLGLAIVKHVMVRHNARLEISSQPNKGSSFKCIFPLSLIVDHKL